MGTIGKTFVSAEKCNRMPAMSDTKTTVQALKARVQKFNEERDWSKFHDPKNLAEALSIEAGELLEHFLWKDKKEIAKLLEKDAAYRQEISDELGDIFSWVLQLSHVMHIDLATALHTKYEKNAKKYPVEKAKGNNIKYNKL